MMTSGSHHHIVILPRAAAAAAAVANVSPFITALMILIIGPGAASIRTGLTMLSGTGTIIKKQDFFVNRSPHESVVHPCDIDETMSIIIPKQ